MGVFHTLYEHDTLRLTLQLVDGGVHRLYVERHARDLDGTEYWEVEEEVPAGGKGPATTMLWRLAMDMWREQR